MASPSVTTPKYDVPALWLEHKNALRSYILKRMKDEDLTNDLLQETLLKVYKFCLSSSGVKNVKSWLYQIAPNVMIDHFRKNYGEITSSQKTCLPEEDENLK